MFERHLTPERGEVVLGLPDRKGAVCRGGKPMNVHELVVGVENQRPCSSL